MVNAWGLEPEGREFGAPTLGKTLQLLQCLSPPTRINGKQQIALGQSDYI